MASDQDNTKQNQPQGEKPHGDAKPRPEGKGGGRPEGKAGGEQRKGGGKPQGGGGGGKGKKDAAPTEPVAPSRMRTLYKDKVHAGLKEKFGLDNPNAMPKLEKITLNVNMGRHIEGTKIPPVVRTTVLDTLTKVTGQKPIVQKAKKSVANFKVRAGLESSAMVTLRRDRMWHFLDRFINLATPRIKDFRGLSRTAFDRQGNYSTGVNEQGVFPEINMAEAQFTHGMNINFTFSRSDPEKSRYVLETLGMPFAKPEEKGSRK
jgi:large subunit ribosomal protein L5